MRLGHEDVLWVLGGLCHTNRIPFDPKLVLQSYPPPHSDATLIESARALGFRLGRSTVSRDSLDKSKSPTVAFLKGRAVTSPPPAEKASKSGDHEGDGKPNSRIALILRSDGDRLLYFEAGSTRPNSTSWTRAGELFEKDCYLVALEQKRDAANEEDEAKTFGFGWFATELLKHKGIWRSVLGISLAMQIIGLATPLFTQVIIDKVVVHQTQSTLIVIAIALAFSMVFSAAMSWVRQAFHESGRER